MNLLEGYLRLFLVGYVETRTAGSSSRHKYPTLNEIQLVAGKYGSTAEDTKAELDKLVSEKILSFDGCYYASPEFETDVL